MDARQHNVIITKGFDFFLALLPVVSFLAADHGLACFFCPFIHTIASLHRMSIFGCVMTLQTGLCDKALNCATDAITGTFCHVKWQKIPLCTQPEIFNVMAQVNETVSVLVLSC